MFLFKPAIPDHAICRAYMHRELMRPLFVEMATVCHLSESWLPVVMDYAEQIIICSIISCHVYGIMIIPVITLIGYQTTCNISTGFKWNEIFQPMIPFVTVRMLFQRLVRDKTKKHNIRIINSLCKYLSWSRLWPVDSLAKSQWCIFFSGMITVFTPIWNNLL